jgi:hypothetical protein
VARYWVNDEMDVIIDHREKLVALRVEMTQGADDQRPFLGGQLGLGRSKSSGNDVERFADTAVAY